MNNLIETRERGASTTTRVGEGVLSVFRDRATKSPRTVRLRGPASYFFPPTCRAAVTGLLGLLLVESQAWADSLPSGSIGASTVLVTGTGSTRSQLGLGFGVGFTAAWQPMRTDQFVGYGLRWSTQFLFFNYLGEAESARINSRLKMYQADFGARARIAISPQNYLTIGAGLALLRSTEPVIAEGPKSWAGPFGAIGLDRYVLGGLLMTLDLRYGLLTQGPKSIGVSLTLGTGT